MFTLFTLEPKTGLSARGRLYMVNAGRPVRPVHLLGSSPYGKCRQIELWCKGMKHFAKRRKPAILIVDDDCNDRFLIQTALRQIGVDEAIYGVSDGVEAVAYLKGEGEYADREIYHFPTLLLTDLKMPRMNGFELLRFLRENPNLSVIPAVVLSSSTDPNDISNAYLLGARSYQVKAPSMSALREQVRLIYDYWRQCEMAELDESGHLLPTEGSGKLSEGVINPHELAISN